MSWFDKPFEIKVDPDHRQDKSNSECLTRQMTLEEVEKYGPKSDKQKRGFLFRQSDIQRSLEHRGIKKGTRDER